jgi:hypothetical protein
MSATDEEIWPTPAQKKKLPPDTSKSEEAVPVFDI